jgi:hypothetical protein
VSLPIKLPYVLAGQGLQNFAPVSSAYAPAAQGAHVPLDVAALAALAVPRAQG